MLILVLVSFCFGLRNEIPVDVNLLQAALAVAFGLLQIPLETPKSR
jgi:hypothetical protein